MRNAVIVDAVRTASGRGKPGGALSGIHPVELFANVLSALADRNGLDPVLVDDVITGCVGQGGEQALNIGRHSVLSAGWPESVPATTIDRQCGSSQQAVHFAAQGVMAGACDIVVAGGVESMSRVPMGATRMGADVTGPGVRRRYPEGLVNQGVSAELVADRWKLTRDDLDAIAARSHQRAAAAEAGGVFDAEIVPIRVTTPDGTTVEHRRDQTIRPATTPDGLSGLPVSFADEPMRQRFPHLDWKITPGNSSPLTDGASATLIMGEDVAERLGLRARARLHTFAVAGDDPVLMLTAPIPATQKALARSGLSIDDIDVYEVNEAFAPVPLAWQREFNADPDKLNPYGGAIALGHPLGASGTRILATMLSYLDATGGRYGLQTMCEAAGLANATIIERL
jgi:acetyl-CoA acyltransferase